MLPATVGSRRNGTISAVLTVRRDGILIEPAGRDAKNQPVIAADAESAVEHLRQKYFRIRIARPGVAVMMDSDRFLMRQVSPFRMPRSRLAAMARLDVHASTPFALQEVFLLCGKNTESDPASRYAVVKKEILKPLLDALEGAGIAVRRFGFAGENEKFRPDENSLLAMFPPSRWQVFAGRAMAVGVAICLLGAALTVSHAHWRYFKASEALDQEIGQAEHEASLVRALIAARNLKISQVTAIRNEKRGAVPLVSIIEELSRVIPDTTWLTDVEISGDEIVFSGFSQSAAALIPLLEESKLFQAPTFRTPVVRVANQNGERFTIAMGVEAGDG